MPTGRYHGRTLFRPSPPACATQEKVFVTLAGSGPPRVRRGLLWTYTLASRFEILLLRVDDLFVLRELISQHLRDRRI